MKHANPVPLIVEILSQLVFSVVGEQVLDVVLGLFSRARWRAL